MQSVGWKRLTAPEPASVDRLNVPSRVARLPLADRAFQRRMARRSGPGVRSSWSCRAKTSAIGRSRQSSMYRWISTSGSESGAESRPQNSRSSPLTTRLTASVATLSVAVTSRGRNPPASQVRSAGSSRATSA